MRYLTWLFWTLAYAVRPRPKDFEGYLMKAVRTKPPWWRFEPSVIRNDDGRMWQVYLLDERPCYTGERTLRVDAHVTEDGRIAGFDVWDETLETPQLSDDEERERRKLRAQSASRIARGDMPEDYQGDSVEGPA